MYDRSLQDIYGCDNYRVLPKSTEKYQKLTLTLLVLLYNLVAKISAVSRKLVQPKRTIKQNLLRGKM